MADSKNKKTTPAASTAKKTAATTKAASKPVTKSKAAANNATSKATTTVKATTDSTKPATTKPATTKSATTKSATTKSATTKSATTKSASQGKTKESESIKATEKTTEKSAAPKTATAPSKKEKSSGAGIAFLALLCSLGALGLSGYNYYLQNLSPQSKQSQNSLLTGVNEIKSNVTEFGTVITGLQKEVQDFKESQSQYITEDTLTAAVKEGVDKAVQNLPDLPDIGPKSLGLEAQEEAEKNQLETQDNLDATNATGSLGGNSKETDQVTTDVTTTHSEVSTSVDKQETSNEQIEDDSFWSWNRAKRDMKDMLKSFIKIEKTEQD